MKNLHRFLSACTACCLLTLLPACTSTATKEAIKANDTYLNYCKTAAGQKIYKTVQNVDAVFLEKVPSEPTELELSNRFYLGAAFGNEWGDGMYIGSFIREYRSDQTLNPATETSVSNLYTKDLKTWGKDRPGYKFVQAYEGNTLYDYSKYLAEVPGSPFKELRDITVKKSPSKVKARYMVTYEHHLNPDDRRMGIASNTVRVIDTQTGEVLGEYVRYVQARNSFLTRRSGPAWAAQNICGAPDLSGRHTNTFVHRVLIPSQ